MGRALFHVDFRTSARLFVGLAEERSALQFGMVRRRTLPAELEAQMAQIAENLSALPIDLQDRIEQAFESATTLNPQVALRMLCGVVKGSAAGADPVWQRAYLEALLSRWTALQ